MKTGLAPLIAAAFLMACSSVPDAGGGLPTLSLTTLWGSYQSYTGKVVIVEGFLIKQGRKYFLLQGSKSSLSDEISDGADSIAYYCTFQNQPMPMQVFGLHRNDLRTIVSRVKNRPDDFKIEGQKVKVMATVQAVPRGTEGTSQIILPSIVMTSGSIEAARIVAVIPEFCRGDQP